MYRCTNLPSISWSCCSAIDCIVAKGPDLLQFVCVCVSLIIFPTVQKNQYRLKTKKARSLYNLVKLIFNTRQHVTKQIIQTTAGKYFLNTVVLRTRNNGRANLSVHCPQNRTRPEQNRTGSGFMGKQVQNKKILIQLQDYACLLQPFPQGCEK